MGFTISALATCDVCGAGLGSSDETCTEHTSSDVSTHVFRRFSTTSTHTVDATAGHKWQKLVDQRGDDWIAWQYLGTQADVDARLGEPWIDGVDEIRAREHALDAPKDLSE